MNGNILDSNIIIDLFRKDAHTIERLRKLSDFYVSTIELGELYYGASLSKNPTNNISYIEKFSENVTVVFLDKETAKVYGEVKSKLKKQGTPIPENDIWIASIAIQHDLNLVTNDKHFKNVIDLKTTNF